MSRRARLALLLYGALALFTLAPAALLGMWSAADFWPAGWLAPAAWTWRHWHDVFDDPGVISALALSLAIAVAVALLTAAIAAPTAWAMVKGGLPGRRMWELAVLAPSIVPGIVVAVSVGEVFMTLGLAYTTLGVVLVHTLGALPLSIRLLMASFEALPDELILAARSLGAGGVSIAFRIVAPLSAPGLIASGLLSFVSSFEEFERSFVVGAPSIQTLPIKLYNYLDPQTLQIPLAATVSLILLAPALAVFLFVGKALRGDALAGAGKV